MIGFVIVSHSAKIAEGVCELAGQVAQGKVALAPAGGTGDAQNPIGTDAFRVLQAIESVYSEDGVIVMTDLGSAELSAETALEMLDAEKRGRVHISMAPLVEGSVAAVSQAAAGAGIEEILSAGLLNATPAAEPIAAEVERQVTVPEGLGLHARPAARLIRCARQFQARMTIENESAGTGPADVRSLNAILGLGARGGHRLKIRAEGAQAREAAEAIAQLIGEMRDRVQTPPVAGTHAIPGSAGIAIGPLFHFRHRQPVAERRTVADPEAEVQRLHGAIARAQAETRRLYESTRSEEAGIFDAQYLLLEDPELTGRVEQLVRQERVNAEWAWQSAAESMVAADMADVSRRVLRILNPAPAPVALPAEPAILAAHDLLPSEVKDLDPARVLGLCLESSSASAHSIILARAMGIPSIVGVGARLTALDDGTRIAMDGDTGELWVSPPAAKADELRRKRELWLGAHRTAREERHKPARTRDGRVIRVFANISGVEEAAAAVDAGAEGVGVLRTEFLFFGRTTPPDEEEQATAYCAIAEALRDRPLVIRTLDIGGDKSLPYVEIGEERNPFLGWRGIRLTLDRLDLLRTQLRAIERTATGHRVEILLPMISTLEELRAAKALVAAGLKVGVMIEVPAAVAIADSLGREASFFSIGTNDLVQYVMAADRTNARVARMADALQPAVLRMLRQTIEAARRAGIPATLCGELAADTLATPLLLGLGLEEFSVSAPLIPDLKRSIRRWSMAEAERVARQALELDTSEAVRALLRSLG